MDRDFAGAHMTWNNMVRCTAEEKEKYYKQDSERVLKLFVFAAEHRCSVEADTMHAALSAAPGIRALSGKTAGAAAQRLLLSHGPRALAMLVERGAYQPFGLPACHADTKGIALLPENSAVRWQVFLRRCRVPVQQYEKIAAALSLPAAPQDVMAVETLAQLSAPPEDVPALKRLLSRLPASVPYAAAAQMLAYGDGRWAGQAALYETLLASHEPYLFGHLAVTRAELLAAHIPSRKIPHVMRGLLDAVIAAPQINYPQALLELAPLFVRL